MGFRTGSKGFTLIELVVVIVILGILAATALPKFIDMRADARIADVNAMAGTLNSAVNLVTSTWQARGSTGTTVTMADGTVVTVNSANGIPSSTAAGIGAAINCTAASCGGFTVNFAPLFSEFQPSGGSGNCEARYNPALTPPATAVTTNCSS